MSRTTSNEIDRPTYLGLFLVTLATLMYEILLTRIFSVTMWYHFAFVAISVAMFGMSVGAIIVYLRPRRFTTARATTDMARSALWFGISLVASFIVHLLIPTLTGGTFQGPTAAALTYPIIAIPFTFSGICVCLALTKFPQHVSRLYAADLAGAATGCLLLIAVLQVTDGPTAVLAVACLACCGAACFASRRQSTMQRNAFAWCAAFAVLAIIPTAQQTPWLRLRWVKGAPEQRPLYERWNSFSRVTVSGNSAAFQRPFGWGFSSMTPQDRAVRQLMLLIDGNAGTVLTGFTGDLKAVDYLAYDVINIAHYLRRRANVLVVGMGGGRDILSALVFNQRTVVGVEINEAILNAVTRRFGEFTGHLDRDPRVRLVQDEARSYIARTSDRFDLIQISLIDTWAATTAGAFVLAENTLYTQEAWKIFLEHLSPRGIFTISRWYFRDRPGEMYRLTALAASALKQFGIQQPQGHILIVRQMRDARDRETPEGIGTMLVSLAPFSSQDVATFERIAAQLKFDVVLSPHTALDATFASLVSGEDVERLAAAFPLNIAPPTDDKPFFFHMLRLRDAWHGTPWDQGVVSFNMKAITVLGTLLVTVLGLTVLCILLPLALSSAPLSINGAWPLIVFFGAIGLGFMLIEISQMQRLIVFLGHPTYGLSVVLFTLLLSSGLGSRFTQSIASRDLGRIGTKCLILLLMVLGCCGLLTPDIITHCQGLTTPLRILVSMSLLVPQGFVMGMPFPIGIKAATQRSTPLMPWLWGINGAMSVCSSVLAVVIALSAGINASFWSGVACYGIATLGFSVRMR